MCVPVSSRRNIDVRIGPFIRLGTGLDRSVADPSPEELELRPLSPVKFPSILGLYRLIAPGVIDYSAIARLR